MLHRRSIALIALFSALLIFCSSLQPGVAAGDSTAPAGDLQAAWRISVLDGAGDVGYFTATAVDQNNKVHISYMDNTHHVLKYATNATGAWVIADVRPLNGLQNTAIGVDSAGKVYIAYVAGDAGGIAIRDLAGNWTTTSAGFHYALANGISLAIDRNDIVHVAAATRQQIQYQPDTYRLEYANNSSGSFKVEKYLPTCMTGAITLRSPSVATDAASRVYVAFNVSDALVYATNKSGDWACNYIALSGAQPVYYSNRYIAVKTTGQPVVAVISGTEFMALAVDAQDKSHIVGLQNNCLRYFTDASGSLQAAYLDCTSAKVGEYGSIAADAEGGIHIAYFDRTNGDLKYATQDTTPPKRKIYLPLLLSQAPPAPSPTVTATATASATTTPTATATVTVSASSTPTATATPTISETSTPTATATVTPTPTNSPGSLPQDGNWAGVTDLGGTFSFQVSGGGTQISWLILCVSTGGACGASTVCHSYPAFAIVDGRFATSSWDSEFAGSFTSPGAAIGTYKSTVSNETGCRVTRTGTWSASFAPTGQ